MFPCDCALAVLLLTVPDHPTLAPFAPVLEPALVHVAVLLELCDPREANPGAQELHTRWQELQHAPRLDECRRLPPKGFIDDWLATNRAYKTNLEARLAVDRVHATELQRALAETEELYRLWGLVRDAQHDCYYITARRRALEELRDLVGPQAFYSGKLPPHLPVWHFPAWR